MNCVFDPARFSSDWMAVLRGGQSPLYWARDLSRRTERLTRMRHACDWVEELMEVNPRICNQPLMGNCLAALTQKATEAPSVASIEPRKEQRQFTGPDSAAKRNSHGAAARPTHPSLTGITSPPVKPSHPRISNARRNTEIAQSAYQPKKVYELQPQADGTLLRRVAGLRGDAFRVEGMPRQSIPTPQRSTHNRVPPVLNERMKRRDWRDQMAQRTAGSLLRNWNDATQATTSNGRKQFVSPSLTKHDIEQIVSLSLTEQWLMPISGTQAPANVLAQLANLAASRNVNAAPETERRREQAKLVPRSSPHLSDFSGVPDALINQRQDSLKSNNSDSAPGHLVTNLPQEQSTGFMPEDDLRHSVAREQRVKTSSARAGDSWRPAHSRENAAVSPANIAPPTLTPSLPPLRPPQAPGIAAMPLAAATAYQGARQEEAIAQEEDLGLLAAQIKRIIDDEARRHGIDV